MRPPCSTYGKAECHGVHRLVERPSVVMSPQHPEHTLQQKLQLIGHSTLAFAGNSISMNFLRLLEGKQVLSFTEHYVLPQQYRT